MKIRLTQPGWENYTGQMGVIWFEDGLSVEHVARFDALRISAAMFCEDEDGNPISLTQEIIARNSEPAPVVADHLGNEVPVTPSADIPVTQPAVTPAETSQVAAETEKSVAEQLAADPAATPASERRVYTVEELEIIADVQGIKGLRAVADPLGVKNQSIAGLIKEMVDLGHATQAQAAE